MSAPAPAAAPAIEVRGVVNRFGAQVVHDGLDMTVVQGEVFGIVGGSGTGKSVLLRTILGLHRPQAGEVRIFGTDLTRLADAELRAVKAPTASPSRRARCSARSRCCRTYSCRCSSTCRCRRARWPSSRC